jgi:hypothetical protein
MVIYGGCHCGNIQFTLPWYPAPAEIVARACTCSFCTKHGNVWTSRPESHLDVAIRYADRVVHYEFGTRTAKFHICSICGIVPLVTSRIDGRTFAVVNANTFSANSIPLRRVSATLDDENETMRLARRARNWIGRVTFRAQPAV